LPKNFLENFGYPEFAVVGYKGWKIASASDQKGS
jgi:hypothetical protein